MFCPALYSSSVRSSMVSLTSTTRSPSGYVEQSSTTPASRSASLSENDVPSLCVKSPSTTSARQVLHPPCLQPYLTSRPWRRIALRTDSPGSISSVSPKGRTVTREVISSPPAGPAARDCPAPAGRGADPWEKAGLSCPERVFHLVLQAPDVVDGPHPVRVEVGLAH